MGRLIKKGEAFEWIEYETGEELVPFYSFEYKGNVSQIYLKENNDNLDVIFNFIDIKENIEYLTEKVVFSFCKNDILGIRKMDLFMSLDNLINIKEIEKISLIYKFKNPIYIGWYLKNYKNSDILVFIDSSSKYEMVLRKNTKPLIGKTNVIQKEMENNLKKVLLDLYKRKKDLKIKKEHTMELTNEKITEKINSVLELKRNITCCHIEDIENLKIKIEVDKKYYFIIKYDKDKINNFQYIHKKYANTEDFFDIAQNKENFYFVETQNSKFCKYSDYDNLGIDSSDDWNSHKYIFSNIILEVLIEEEYYPEVFIQEIKFL